ncbi:LysR family transcriptional regulator [Actinomycetospora cinnamomea]|uniref:DNA-binding transcriptional LysR family regulator n=1 Tax=Actinomycetospora cinnamomea TaxID=663609 RepID=A0A2U1FI98_9PSEU|nr:LysR family transcriptional regulator [Actinomycetospora cinnamomea]PVZ11899.1 DNA-binding transcriptional LysR family regulator [Actinomycetospora cinnamomea]
MFALDRLRALHALATHRSVAGAAVALHLTPSAVSQQLAKLEREAGAALTEPAGRGVRLTPAGRVLAEHAADILARVAAARLDLDRLRDEVVGELRIGAIPTSVHALAPPTLARLRAAHPDLRVALADGEAEETLPAVLAGDLDLAVVENWEGLPAPVPAGTSRARLCEDVIDLVLPAGHRLAGPGPVALGEVDDLDWVADGGDTRAQAWLLQTLRSLGLEPRVTCRVRGFGMHLELVAGVGVAALVPRLARPPLPAGVAVAITEPVLRRSIDAVWRTDRGTPAVHAAVAAFTAVAAERDAAREAAQASQASGASTTSASKQV